MFASVRPRAPLAYEHVFPQESIHEEIRLALSELDWQPVAPARPTPQRDRARETSAASLAATIARRLKGAARISLELAIDFLTLEDGRPASWSGQDEPVREAPAAGEEGRPARGGAHPHRRPLAPVRRERRPGSVAGEPQLCVTPIGVPPAPAVPLRPRREHSTA